MPEISKNIEENPFPVNFCPGQIDVTEVPDNEIETVCRQLIELEHALMETIEEELIYADPDKILAPQFRQSFIAEIDAGNLEGAMDIILKQAKFMEEQHNFLKNRQNLDRLRSQSITNSILYIINSIDAGIRHYMKSTESRKNSLKA